MRERERERAMGPLTTVPVHGYNGNFPIWAHTQAPEQCLPHTHLSCCYTQSLPPRSRLCLHTHTGWWRDDPAWGLISAIDSLWSFRSFPSDLPPQNAWQTTCLLRYNTNAVTSHYRAPTSARCSSWHNLWLQLHRLNSQNTEQFLTVNYYLPWIVETARQPARKVRETEQRENSWRGEKKWL